MAAQKRELHKLIVQAVVAVREGDRIVDEEAGLWVAGPDGPLWAAEQRQAIYGPEQAKEFYEEQEVLCKAAQPNRAARRK